MAICVGGARNHGDGEPTNRTVGVVFRETDAPRLYDAVIEAMRGESVTERSPSPSAGSRPGFFPGSIRSVELLLPMRRSIESACRACFPGATNHLEFVRRICLDQRTDQMLQRRQSRWIITGVSGVRIRASGEREISRGSCRSFRKRALTALRDTAPPKRLGREGNKALSSSNSDRDLSPAKRRVFRLLAIVLSLLLCFLCLEIGLRIWGPKYYRFNNRNSGFYSNPRGYFDVIEEDGHRPLYGILIHTVEGGGSKEKRVPDYFRTQEELEAFVDRKNTILGLGDSFTMGQGVRYEHIYLRQLEKRLARDGMPILINNTALPHTDLLGICNSYDYESAQNHHPLVIYGFVLNDFGMPGVSKVVGLDYIDLNNGGNEFSLWRSNVATVNFIGHAVDTIRLDWATRKIYLNAFKGENARKHFELLADLNGRIQTDNSRLVIVLFPLLYEFDDYPFEEIHDKIADFCQEEDIPLLDLLPAFSKHRAKDLWVHPTDHHPNDIAHEITAGEVYRFLKREGLLEFLPMEEDGHQKKTGDDQARRPGSPAVVEEAGR